MRKVILIMVLFIVGLFYLNAQGTGDMETGKNLLKEKNYSEARTVFESIIEADPENAEGHYHLGKINFVEDKLDDAIKCVKMAVKLDEKNGAYHYTLGRYYGVKINRVSFMAKMGPASNSKKSFERAVELEPDNVTYRMSLMGYLANAPGIAGGDKNKARQQAKEIKKRDPVMGLLASAMIDRLDKKFDSAKSNYIQMLEMIKKGEADPKYRGSIESGLNTVGYGYLGKNKIEEAVEVFKLNVNEFPQSYNAYDSLGEAYMKKGDKSLAIENYKKAMELNPQKSKGQKKSYEGARKTLEKLQK